MLVPQVNIEGSKLEGPSYIHTQRVGDELALTPLYTVFITTDGVDVFLRVVAGLGLPYLEKSEQQIMQSYLKM